MGIYKNFATLPNLEKDGIVLDFGDYKVTVARAGGANERFTKKMAELMKPHRRAIQLDTADPKIIDKLVAQAYAETIFLSWEGITDSEGKPLDFNVQNIIKLLTDLPDFFSEVIRAANNAALFRADYLEADAKNS